MFNIVFMLRQKSVKRSMRRMNNIKYSNSFEGEKYKLLVFIDI